MNAFPIFLEVCQVTNIFGISIYFNLSLSLYFYVSQPLTFYLSSYLSQSLSVSLYPSVYLAVPVCVCVFNKFTFAKRKIYYNQL